MATLPEIVNLPGGSPTRPRGIIAVASPAPEGWEMGGIQFQTVCPTPVIRDQCITITPQAGARPTPSTFAPFVIEQGVECSTTSAGDRAAEARTALQSSTEYGLGIMLRTGGTSNAPSLDDAVSLGEFAGVHAALAALECATGVNDYVLHATPGAAVYLAAEGLIDSTGRSPSGAQWIVSPGYECDEDDTAQRIWATGRVYAAVGDILVDAQVEHRINSREAWANRSAIVAFNPCVLLTATFTPSTGGGSTVDPEARALIEALQEEVADLTAVVAGKANAAHVHAAADVNSGVLDAARIPNLTIAKTTGLQAALDAKVASVVAGTGITVDPTDPQNPVVSTA